MGGERSEGEGKGKERILRVVLKPVREDVLFQSCATNICLLVSLVNLVGELVEQNAIGGI